jgi:hypothetical protein
VVKLGAGDVAFWAEAGWMAVVSNAKAISACDTRRNLVITQILRFQRSAPRTAKRDTPPSSRRSRPQPEAGPLCYPRFGLCEMPLVRNTSKNLFSIRGQDFPSEAVARRMTRPAQKNGRERSPHPDRSIQIAKLNRGYAALA